MNYNGLLESIDGFLYNAVMLYEQEFMSTEKTPEQQAVINAMLEELVGTTKHMAMRIEDYGRRIRTGNI